MGFTLTELLATITIIAVLAALLSVNMSNAEEKARHVQCQSNVRQIGVALWSYADKNRDLLPDVTTNNPSFSASSWPWDLNTNLVAKLEAEGVSRKILYCPSNANMDDDAHWNFWEYHPESPIRVLGYVFLLRGGIMIPKDLWHARMLGKEGADLSKTELVVDAVASTDGDYTRIRGIFLDRTSHLEGPIPEGGNITFADGHAAWRQFKAMQHCIRVDGGVIWDY